MLPPVGKFFATAATGATGNTELIYFRELIGLLEALQDKFNAGTTITGVLKQKLVLINYNKFSFVRYLLNALSTQISQAGSPLAKTGAMEPPAQIL